MTFVRGTVAAICAAGISISTTGCLKKVLLDGQIRGTLQGSAAVNTLHDYEVARGVALAGVGQIEGMHYLAPENTDALFMLTKSWAGISFGFIEDDYEMAYEKGDDVMAEYHLARARAGYARARYYGIELLDMNAKGFDEAKVNDEKMRAWLVKNFNDPDDAEMLLWVGYAWIGHVSASKDIPAIVGELYVGFELVRRSVELDETVQYATGHTILAAYHARTAMSELDESKKDFERALQLNGGKFLPTKLNYAQRYYCAVGDRAKYEQLLNEVIAAPDDLPEARLQNTIAKRRARRYLGNKVWQEECGFRA